MTLPGGSGQRPTPGAVTGRDGPEWRDSGCSCCPRGEVDPGAGDAGAR